MKKFVWTVGMLVTVVATMGVANAAGKTTKGLGDFAAPIVNDKTNLGPILPAGSVVYETLGTGFFGLAPDGSWVPMGIKPSTARPEVRVTGGNGLGNPTGTSVRRFNNVVVDNGGSAILFTPSGTVGDSFTIKEPGVYAITYQDSSTTDNGMVLAISRNASGADLSAAPTSIAAAKLLAVGVLPGTYKIGIATTTIYLNENDVIRAQVDSTANEGADYKVRFSIVKITD